MTARNGAILAYLSLCGGSYFLGVATAIGLVHFDSLPGSWRLRVAITVAVVSLALLSTSAIQLTRNPPAHTADNLRGDDRAPPQGQKRMDAYRTAKAGLATVSKEEAVAKTSGFAPHSGRNNVSRADRSDEEGVPIEEGVRRKSAVHRSAAALALHDGPPLAPSGSVADGDTPPSRTTSTPATEPNPRSVTELQPSGLIAAWDTYRRSGDGHFNDRGLQRVLDKRGIEAIVSGGDRIGVGSSALIVESSAQKGHFYVLPSFAKSPRAVSEWFDDSSGRSLTGRTERVINVAEGRWTGNDFQVVRRGEVA